tara:strand:+ start:336 stop:659 length:324 start_codon:yes stop_codon:yes gene_type:complete
MNFKNIMVEGNDGFNVIIKCYKLKGLMEENKLIETDTFNKCMEKMKTDMELEDMNDMEDTWNEFGMCHTWQEEVINQKITGMLQEKKLHFNPVLCNGYPYYIESEIL